MNKLIFVMCCTVSVTMAQELPRDVPIPGGIAVIPLGEDPASVPQVWYGDNRVLVVSTDGLWHAIVGIPLSAEPGDQAVAVRYADATENRYTFRVEPKEYAAQHITLSNKRQVNPSARDLRRIERENKRMRAVFAHYDARAVDQAIFEQPADGEISGTFGLRRFFNGEPRQPHSGVDFAAPVGTPVRAPADATVVLTGNFFFNGQSIFLDHGQGVISMMNHLSRIDVRDGQAVTRGEVIGAVGATGRATGPHLHWTLSLNNARVDPLLFLPPMPEPATPDTTPMQMGE